jgi:2-polyprenyl-6-methoxyphenol hydroxylase-like FAD-dependent oxidoreductase
MYPMGSNGASQAILDARCVAQRLAETKAIQTALVRYEGDRLPATARIVRENRTGGPERVIDVFEERAPNGFTNVHEVVSRAELEAIVKGYATLAGFDKAHVNR